MIALAVTYLIQSGHEDEAVSYLAHLASETRKEPGCRMYVAHRAQSNPRKFFIYEQYDDAAALDRHRATPHFERYGKNGLQTIMETREPELYDPLG